MAAPADVLALSVRHWNATGRTAALATAKIINVARWEFRWIFILLLFHELQSTHFRCYCQLLFDRIEPRHIDEAVARAKSVSRGLRSEVKERINNLTDHFHENEDWERVSSNWEKILRDAVDWDDMNGDEGLAVHGSTMALMAVMFCIGFDAGEQSVVDTTVEKLLKAPSDGRPPKS